MRATTSTRSRFPELPDKHGMKPTNISSHALMSIEVEDARRVGVCRAEGPGAVFIASHPTYYVDG